MKRISLIVLCLLSGLFVSVSGGCANPLASDKVESETGNGTEVTQNPSPSNSDPLPDLIIESVCAKPEAATPGVAGLNYIFYITLKNIGTAPYTNYFYISHTTSEASIDKNEFGSGGIVNYPQPQTIDPGQSIEVTQTASFIESVGSVGFAINWQKGTGATSLMVGDTENKESDYTNNTFILKIPPTTHYTLTNVTDTGFSLYWPGQEQTTCFANWGMDPGHLDTTVWNDEGKDKLSAGHQVTISGLSAGTTVYFELGAGDIVYRDYCDVPWEFTTPPALEPRTPDIISGQVTDRNGNTLDDVIVMLKVYTPEESDTLAATVSDGNWSIDLAQLRTLDFSGYYPYDDTTNLVAEYWVFDPSWGIGGTLDHILVAEARQGIAKQLDFAQ